MAITPGFLVNVTGKELAADMACPSTIEPYRLDNIQDDPLASLIIEENFYDEANKLLDERVQVIVQTIEKHKDMIRGIIIENNELGRAVFEKLSNSFQFVSSVKRPGSKLHWYWTIIDRIKDPFLISEKESIQ